MKRRTIVWSPRAESELLLLLQYLYDEWGERTAESVLDKIERSLLLTARMPYVFPKHPTLKQRYFIINGLTRVYYKSGRSKIEVGALYDNRRDSNSYKG